MKKDEVPKTILTTGKGEQTSSLITSTSDKKKKKREKRGRFTVEALARFTMWQGEQR